MHKKVTAEMCVDELRGSFSREAALALFEHYTDEMELDASELKGMWDEFDSLQEAEEYYEDEDLEDNAEIIEFDDGVLVQYFW